MDVLKHLFEQHFHAPPEHVTPLQGQLGGSGRAIVRLSGGASSAIGIVYPVREENIAFLRRILPKAPISKKTSATPLSLNS